MHMSKIIFFDAASTGHHGEFLENIIDCVDGFVYENLYSKHSIQVFSMLVAIRTSACSG